MLLDMGSNNLSNPKPLERGSPTQDWTPLFDSMPDKPIKQNLFNMALDRIV
jgi:hypothetical protein